jgi:hypothetical protein
MSTADEATTTETPTKKPGHLRRQAPNYAKLVAAIGALTAAVNGYYDLAKKNELVYQALASKVNNMAVEMAEVKGQNQVILIFLAQQSGNAEMLEEMGAREPASEKPNYIHSYGHDDESDPAEGEGAEEPEAMSDEPAMAVEVESDEPPPPKKEKKVVVQAYQELPSDLAQLIQVQEQLQVQEE